MLHGSSNNNIYGNNVEENESGMRICCYSSNNNISGNRIAASGCGILLEDSSVNNVCVNSFFGCGLCVFGSYYNVVNNNFVNNMPLIYVESKSDLVIREAGQVVLVRCSRIRIDSIPKWGAIMGILLWETKCTEIIGIKVDDG